MGGFVVEADRRDHGCCVGILAAAVEDGELAMQGQGKGKGMVLVLFGWWHSMKL